MKHSDLIDLEFYTEITPSAQHFIDRFCYVLYNDGPFVKEFDFVRSSMLFMPIIKFKLIATDGDMMRRLLDEFPYMAYEPGKFGIGFTDPKMPFEISDSTYGDKK